MQLWLFFSFYLFTAAWTIGFLFYFRKHIACMAGMMTAMAAGMIVGFGSGALFAVLFPSNFIISAFLGILVGMTVGGLTGSIISLMAILDGALSGVMAGMMGAMFVTMLPSSQWNEVIYFTLALSGLLQFILTMMLQSQLKMERLRTSPWVFRSPAIIFCTVAVSVIIAQLFPLNMESSDSNPHHHQSLTSKIGISDQFQEANTPSLNITASEFDLSPNTLKIDAGGPFTITFQNKGKTEHDVEIVGTDIHLHALPGQTDSTTASIPESGVYRMICTIPGHQEMGMYGTVTVTNSFEQ